MIKPYKIPVSLLFAMVAILAIGEIVSGTKLFFVAAMAGTLLCIGTTYNILGGVSTISGIAFAGFASCTIVISQFAKVILMEAADKTLESPELTIKVYFVFYLCALIGCFVYGRLRIRIPRPLEPATTAQANLQYGISVSVGLAANLVYEIYESSSNLAERATTAHSIGLAFSTLLLFSIVLAVQNRIRTTDGRHSFGLKVFIPWIATIFFGFIETSRGHMILSTVVYAFTCYLTGYKFKRRHYLGAILGVAAFIFILSPFEIYSRGPMRELEFRGRLYEGLHLAMTMPDWSVVRQASSAGIESGSREEYYEKPGTFVLSRLSAIRADSNMINACAGGFHYGFTALRIDLLRSLPRFLYKNKPDIDGASYTGRVTGVNSDEVVNGEFLITAVSDSFGAFGWLGVIVVSLLGFPTAFILYESMFDIRKPWGIVAAVGFFFQFSETSMSGLIALAVRAPLAILALSYVVGVVVRMIPVKGYEWFALDQAPAE
ncbi:MAG TPA: hypothetical protein VGG56_11665 [Terracidiphilus sp.]|jgi:hypothetical protein